MAGMLLVSRWLGAGGSFERGSRDAEAVAEQLVQDSVGDADTQFRNVMAYRAGPSNERWVCGWFYARSAGGETTGARRFVVHVLLADSVEWQPRDQDAPADVGDRGPEPVIRLGELLPLTVQRRG